MHFGITVFLDIQENRSEKEREQRDQVGSRSRHERYRSLDRQVKSSAREDKQKWLDSMGTDI